MQKLKTIYDSQMSMMAEGRLDVSFVTATHKDEASRLISKFSSSINTLNEILRKV